MDSGLSNQASLEGKSIFFIGAGAFGISSAYHIARRIDLAATGTSVTVFDRFPYPSQNAASTDLNKVIRADYSEPIYANLAAEAMAEWKKTTGPLAGLYKQTGWFLAGENVSIPFIETSIQIQRKKGNTSARKVTAEEARKICPAYNGPMKDWSIWWNSSAGWARSGDGVAAIAKAAESLGVKYMAGSQGWVKKLLYSQDGKTCIGVQTADGTTSYADIVVVSAGAASSTLLDFEGQLQAKGHVVGHIKLRSDEIEKYRDLKILDHFEEGYFFPPNPDGIIKVASVRFLTNSRTPQYPAQSVPRYRSDHPQDDVPDAIQRRLRDWLAQILPDLAERPWHSTRLCWDTDTPDLHFLIDKHPAYNGLYVATGGSEHGFKFLPVIGKYVANMLESKLDPTLAHAWAWRPHRPLAKKRGPEPHPYPAQDLGEFPGYESRTMARL